MVEFNATIQQFEEKGDKTGWSYIEVPVDLAQLLYPGNKKSFQVKGRIDKYVFKNKSLLPMGGGNFIFPLDATIRKAIHKGKGAMVKLQLTHDSTPFTIPEWLTDCLEDEPVAKERFHKFTMGVQNYYIKWVESAKTEQTKTKRIAQVVSSLLMGLDFGGMIRMNRENKV